MRLRTVCALLALFAPLAAGARPQVTVPSPAPSSPAPTTTPPPPPPPAELVGRVDLKEKDGRVVPAEGTVVWVEGGDRGDPGGPPVIMSRNKRFTPHVVAVRRGAQVTFPNVDQIFHNAFSRTPGSEFDLGLYRRGARRSVRLGTAGLVRVYCNIHPEMAAYVMVVDRAAYGVSGADGTFRVTGIPAGRRTVRLWNEKTGEQERALAFRAGERQRLEMVLDGSGYRPLPHKNKHGKDYPPVTQDVDRY